MKKLETQILIEAPVELVWMAFVDFESYPKWNPFMSIHGQLVVGEKIKIEIKIKDKKSVFKPRVLSLEQERKLEWKGQLVHKRIFSGLHYFHFSPEGEGQTLFVHGEEFSGVFSKTIMRKIEVDTLNGFEEMNKALKQYAEDMVI